MLGARPILWSAWLSRLHRVCNELLERLGLVAHPRVEGPLSWRDVKGHTDEHDGSNPGLDFLWRNGEEVEEHPSMMLL